MAHKSKRDATSFPHQGLPAGVTKRHIRVPIFPDQANPAILPETMTNVRREVGSVSSYLNESHSDSRCPDLNELKLAHMGLRPQTPNQEQRPWTPSVWLTALLDTTQPGHSPHGPWPDGHDLAPIRCSLNPISLAHRIIGYDTTWAQSPHPWPDGVPDRIRTCDLRIRNPTFYPTELRGPAQALVFLISRHTKRIAA